MSPSTFWQLVMGVCNRGGFTCSILASIVTILVTIVAILTTHEYWANTWEMCLLASSIFTSSVTILVSFEAILMYFKYCDRSLLWNWLLKLILKENLFKIASKLTSIATILVNIALAGDLIFQVLTQY